MQLFRKIILPFLAIFVVLFLAGSVYAESPNYDILRIKVNGQEAFEQGGGFIIPNLDVERGERVDIEVVIRANDTISGGLVPDVRVEFKVIGYEFGPISDITPLFSVEQGLTYIKSGTLFIPDDIDASERYNLRIEVSDTLDEEQKEFTLHIDEPRHFLNIFDVLINPSTTIQASQPLFVTPRIENLGEFKEEDIGVKVSIPELGVSANNFIDELIPELEEEEQQFDRDEDSSQQIDLLLRIPEDAQSGDYTVNIDVTYNRGHSFTSATRKITVVGRAPEQEVESIINIDSTTKQTRQGEPVTYKLNIANLGTEKGVYTVAVEGVTWGQVRVEPSLFTVLPDSTGEATITITPNPDAEPRSYIAIATVSLGTEVLNQFSLSTDVQSARAAPTAATALKTALLVIFIILVIVLIGLGIFIAVKRRGEEETEEPKEEAKTFY